MSVRQALWARPACDPDLPERLRLLVTQPSGGGPRRWLQQRELGRHAGRMIFPHDLHRTDRLVLARAQHAIDAILASEVRQAGLVTADEPVLRRHEWEIACVMRDLTNARAVPVIGIGTGALTAAVLDAQLRALALAEEAANRRVSALERYADQVAEADAALRDWQSALRLAGLNDLYLDLVARTAADDLALVELGDLADRAADTVQALRDSLRDASVAAEVLMLPPTQAS